MVLFLKRFAIVGAVALAFASSARADLTLTVDATAFTFTAVDGGANDLDLAVDGFITVDLTALNAALAGANTGLSFDSLGADTNSFNPGDATLNTSGLVRFDGPLGDGLVTVTASSDNYPAVPGGLGTLSSSASDTFGTPGAARTFTSTVDPGNVLFFTGAGSTSSLPLLFAGTNTSTSGAAADVTNIALPGPFSLTNTTNIALSGFGSTDDFTGRTTIRPVPEPGSVALLLMGGAGLAYRLRRRRAIAA